jgi:glycosyltransferase involved in cell wall biosynthesis
VTPTASGRIVRPVLMIVHAYYDEDPRVRREAESLVASGRPVTVIGLRRPEDPPAGRLAGVDVIRLDVQRHQGAGILTYLREYVSFGMRAAWRSMGLHRRERFGLVEIHSLPDFLVFAGLPLRVLGVPVILNLHEAMPEFFKSRFARAANPVFDRLLHWQERMAISCASTTLSVNDAMRDRLLRLGIRPDRVTVVGNSPSLARFDITAHLHRAFREDGSLRLIYAGGLTPTYEVDVAIRAVARLHATRPDLDVRFEVYGRGDTEPALRSLADELGIASRVTFHGRIPVDDVPAAVAAADIGVAPTRRNDFTVLTMSTKIHEYAAMGKPVVATRLPMVERTFPPGSVQTYEADDVDTMVTAIATLADDPAIRSAAIERTARIVRDSAWERESIGYLAIVERLARDGRQPIPVATPSRR